MDADNSIEIASCIKRTGFEKDGARALAVLREHKIQAELTYLQNQRGVKAITENPKQSTEWVIAVNSKDAAEARKLLAAAIKDGLKVVLIGEQKGSKAK